MITFTYQFYYKAAEAVDGLVDIESTTQDKAEHELKNKIRERHPDIPGNWDRYVMIDAVKHKNSYAG